MNPLNLVEESIMNVRDLEKFIQGLEERVPVFSSLETNSEQIDTELANELDLAETTPDLGVQRNLTLSPLD